jgi:hypothetical protein
MNDLNEIGKFDSLFKRAAIDYELPFNEASWDLMQQKLDNANNTKKRGLWFWLPIGTLILGVCIYAFFSKNIWANKISPSPATIINNKEATYQKPNTSHQKNSLNEYEKNKNLVSNELNTLDKISEIHSNNSKKVVLSNNNEDKKEKTKSNVINKNASIIAIEKSENLIKQFPVNTINDADKSHSVDEIPKNASSITSINNNTPINNKTISTLNGIEISTDKKENATRYYTANISQMHNRFVSNFEKAALKNKLEIEELEQAELVKFALDEKLRKEREAAFFMYKYLRYKPSSNWYITAAIGGNIGYISNPAIKDAYLQYNFGLGYNISKYVSFQTGISFGKRTFDARKDQFVYKGPSVQEKFFRTAAANIDVIDIPFTIRYQFSDIENQGLYTTMGISTIFMPKEDYNLTLDYGTTKEYLNQNFNNSRSPLAFLNLSVGYQFPMKKSFTFLLEPYLQLPFKKIGGGGVKMSSVGIQVGLKYSFPKKKY